MRNLFFAFGLLVIALIIFSSATNNSGKYKYLGQTTPPDMEFIPGNDSIPSFFISKSQEINLNYVVYLDWMKRVYVDYPEVAKMAVPHEVEQGILYTYNDPILRGQLRNPAFAYYPVTGVDWLQIQDYLMWKTDRLNESILIELGFFKYNPDQTNEDNFNTETYLSGQYEGKVGKELKDEIMLRAKRKVRTGDGIFFSGYRLPTEAEWEYAAKDEFRNNHVSKGENYPYGKKYFTMKFSYNYNYALAGEYESEDLNRIKGGTTYNNHYYGIYNMGDNVKEWLLDEYSPMKKYYPNAESIYTQNGFYLAEEKMYNNEDGYIDDKDSMGRHPFRAMGFKNNGDDFRVMQYRYRTSEIYITQIPNPDSLKIKIYQRDFFNRQNNMFPIYSDGRGNYINMQYYRRVVVDENGKKVEKLVLDTSLIMNSPQFVNERNYIIKRHSRLKNSSDSIPRNRVVKSGTWRNPSKTARESMKETDASADVGFRTVIPYMAMPTKYKVKWK